MNNTAGRAFFQQARWSEPRVCPTRHDNRTKHVGHTRACDADDCFWPDGPTCVGVFEVLAVLTLEMTIGLSANGAFASHPDS